MLAIKHGPAQFTTASGYHASYSLVVNTPFIRSDTRHGEPFGTTIMSSCEFTSTAALSWMAHPFT